MLKKVKRIKLGVCTYRRIMKRVLERDDWRCQKCGSLNDLQVHHQIKRSQQGDDALRNLVTLCFYCHMAEHGQLGFGAGAVQSGANAQCCGPCDDDSKTMRMRSREPNQKFPFDRFPSPSEELQ